MNQGEKILNMLKKYGEEGATPNDISKSTKLSVPQIHNIVYGLKQKGLMHSKRKGMTVKYCIGGKAVVKKNDTTKHNLASTTKAKISRLSEEDRDNYFGMLQKSLFYAGSSQALLAANEQVEGMKKQL